MKKGKNRKGQKLLTDFVVPKREGLEMFDFKYIKIHLMLATDKNF